MELRCVDPNDCLTNGCLMRWYRDADERLDGEPEWVRMSAITPCMMVFVTTRLSGLSEELAVFRAAFEGVIWVVDGGHFYLPVAWLTKEFPDYADLIGAIEAQVIKAERQQQEADPKGK